MRAFLFFSLALLVARIIVTFVRLAGNKYPTTINWTANQAMANALGRIAIAAWVIVLLVFY